MKEYIPVSIDVDVFSIHNSFKPSPNPPLY